MRVLSLIAALTLLPGCAAAQSSVINNEVEGMWVNERGSTVTLVETDGLLSGHYNTQLGNPDPKSRFPLTGFVEGDQLTFTVNFRGFDSLTSWTGQMSEDEQGRFIRTLWHLTRDVPDTEEEDDLWSSIISGPATFRPVETKSAKEN